LKTARYYITIMMYADKNIFVAFVHSRESSLLRHNRIFAGRFEKCNYEVIIPMH